MNIANDGHNLAPTSMGLVGKDNKQAWSLKDTSLLPPVLSRKASKRGPVSQVNRDFHITQGI